MPPLLSLPTELLIQIYRQCSTLQTAVCLASANKVLRAVWLEHTNEISEAILERQIPEYSQAVELAILEETLINSTQDLETGGIRLPAKNNEMPISTYGRRLLRNADLASSATAKWPAHVAVLREEKQKLLRSASTHSIYYFMRKLFLSRQYPKAGLQQGLYLTLCAMSLDTLVVQEEFAVYLLGYNDDERRRQGILKPEKDWTGLDYEEEGMNMSAPILEPWEYVLDVLSYALEDKRDRGEVLPDEIFDDEPRKWNVDARGAREQRKANS